MSITGAVIVFVLAWWICFLAVLPIGVKGQWENDSTIPGTEEAAPVQPMLVKKVIWASMGAAAVTGLAGLIIPRLLAQ
ncbi:DUF1467 family protein [Hyphomonas sp.]|uniref:DUF1467 family protein n=1 Tax=Hyphomonas sp. TaxID=87 RepID=UPI00391ACAF6